MSLSRRPGTVSCLCLIVALGSARAADPVVPITTRTDPAGLLLRQWFDEGSAAGHHDDFYDNRDKGHSALDLSRYPQLRPLPYTAEQIAAGADYGIPRVIRPETVLGNASLSGPAVNGASIPRLFYSTPEGLAFLSSQYFGNQLYIYPEHQDHDPAAPLGTGWGDLYAVNTPCLLISQGSSGSDQPFLNAVAMTMASFSPEVKKILRERKLLFPVIQQILRSSLKTLTAPGDYFTGVAHPSAFDAATLAEEKMMRLAHAMTPATLPPVFRLQVTASSPAPRRGIDFFEGPAHDRENLADEGVVIARLFRGMARERRLTVGVADSPDTGKNPPVYEWKLLRGDPALVTITPSTSTFAAEIIVTYGDLPQAVPGPAGLTSRRIDIGVFTRNQDVYSPPALITFSFLPNEKRHYDPKSERLLSVDYSFAGSFVDITLSSGKSWRDTYLYDKPAGPLIGWQREEPGKALAVFDPFGRKQGRHGVTSVLYLSDPASHLLKQLSSD